MPHEPSAIDLADVRKRLQECSGEQYWRSLDELAQTPEFREALQREFPALASEWEQDGSSRRDFLKVMGASLALLGLTGCFRSPPAEDIVPYVQPPEELVVGRPMYFASAMPFDGYGRGVLVQSREGRPIKIEGNPDHPASLGATDVFMQAAVLDLYDPDRARTVRFGGNPSRWGTFQNAIRQRLEMHRRDGSGLRILSGPISSPTFAAQLRAFAQRFPGARWHCHDPVRPAGEQGIFAEPVETRYDLGGASIIVALGSDFLFREPGCLRYARQFADGRRIRLTQKNAPTMNRLYVVESTYTITGSMADHRLSLPPAGIEAIAWALARRVGVPLANAPAEELSEAHRRWVEAVAKDLLGADRSRPTLVMADHTQSPATRALAHLINQKVGNIGKSVIYTDPVLIQGGESLQALVQDMQGGRVQTLLILSGNPAYTAPADVPFADALGDMSGGARGGELTNFTAHLSTHLDETSFLCQWHLNEAHWLESWGDVRAFDGTASLMQPLIAPIYEGRTLWEVMDTIIGGRDRSALEIIRDYWAPRVGDGASFERWWVQTLQKGIVQNSALRPRQAPGLREDALRPSPKADAGFTLVFEADASVWDGRFATNAWLQELPKPLTKLTWSNAVVIGVGMAELLAKGAGTLRDGEVVRVTYRGRSIEGPVMLLPGQADDVIQLPLGYGRTAGGYVLLDNGAPRGFSAYRLRYNDALWHGQGATIERTGKFTMLAVTRNHHAMSVQENVPGIKAELKPEVVAEPGETEMQLALENRRLVRVVPLPVLQRNHDAVQDLDPGGRKPVLSLYPGWDYTKGHQWGMNIDMTACIGCNACVIACQAENNIPVVGRDQVLKQREMHWIRIDDYFHGPLDAPRVTHQPVPCMHCENAPCEYVCPTGATVHTAEGLNQMTYNRCIGTRYCSNNCPYKVRRFNFLLYSEYGPPSRREGYNPDVTVRSRGVMEKCTYCLQRINGTRAELVRRTMPLDEQIHGAETDPERQRLQKRRDEVYERVLTTLQTACQQACPTNAITFGDLTNHGAEVVKLKREPTNYVLLRELTTVPRTSYLARITNPNPALADSPPAKGGPA